MPDERFFLAIDAGTTMIKAVLTRADGEFIDTAAAKLQILMPRQGWCEMDMETVWQAVCGAVGTLREKNGTVWGNICAVGICAQGDGMWPVDAGGKPVRNAVLWNDTRAEGLIDYDAINKTCVALGASPLFPGACPVILRWLKEYEPENYRRIAAVLHCKDWLNYRLTGQLATDQSDASTSLMNIYTKKYEFSLLEMLGIGSCQECFPRVAASDEVVGTVTGRATELLGIPKGTPVIAGAIDVLAAATGCGVTAPAQKGTVIGTTLCNYVVLDEDGARVNAGEIGSVLCHTQPGTYIRLMAALSGASALDWVRREILADEPYPQLEQEIDKLPVGSEGVFFHPYLYGERAPFRLGTASSGFFGLQACHTRYHMARAAFEGVALSLYDCYRSLPPGEEVFAVAGGAAKSDLVCQMVCDCMGEKTVRCREKELGILGVVRLLQKACGFPILSGAAERDSFFPDMEKHEQYKKLYMEFCFLKDAMLPFWKRRQ